MLLTATSVGSVIAAVHFRDLADKNLDLSQASVIAREDALAGKAQAELAAKRSADALQLFTGSFLSATLKENPEARPGMKATEVLRNALSALPKSELDAGGQQEMLESLGDALLGLGDYDAAAEAWTMRLDRLEELFGTREPAFPDGVATLEEVPEVDWILDAKTNLAEVEGLNGDYEECLKLHLENFEFTHDQCPDGDRRRVSSTANLATAYMKMEQWDEAVALLETAVAESENVKGEPYENGDEIRAFLATSLASVGNRKRSETSISTDDGELDRAITMLEAELESSREEGVNWMDSASNLAAAYSQNGQYELAVELLQETLVAYRARLGEDHPDTLNAMNSLGECYWKQRDFERSIPLYRDVVAASEEKLGRKNPLTQLAVVNLGVNLVSGGDPAEAAEYLEEAYENGDETAMQYLLVAYCLDDDTEKFDAFVESALDGDMATVAGIFGNYARHFRKNGDYPPAIKINKREIEIREDLPNDWKYDFAIGSLGELYAESGNLEEAMELIEDSRKSLENRIDQLPPEHLEFLIALPVHTLLDVLKEDGSAADIAKWTAEAERVDKLYKAKE